MHILQKYIHIIGKKKKRKNFYTINDPSIVIVNELQADADNLYWSYFDKRNTN